MKSKGRRRWFVVSGLLLSVALLALFVHVVIGAFIGEGGASLTTNTHSDSLPTAAARVAFIARYLKVRTPASDAVFHVVYHDNSGMPPGPSDADIVAAFRVTPADGPTWLEGARPASLADTAGLLSGYQRLPLPPAWRVESAGELYQRQGTWLVWHPEGVIELSLAMH